jgi:hypothetical protein
MNVDRVDALNDQIKDRSVKYRREIQDVRAAEEISPDADIIFSEMIDFLDYISGELNDILDKAGNNNNITPKSNQQSVGGRRKHRSRTRRRHY